MATYAPPLPPKASDKEVNPLVDGETPKTTDKGVAVVSIANALGDPIDLPQQILSTKGTALQKDDLTVSSTDVEILAENINRKSALIQNVGTANIRITWDGSWPTATHGHQLYPGAAFTLDQPFVPTSRVRAIREGSTDSTVSVSEVV